MVAVKPLEQVMITAPTPSRGAVRLVKTGSYTPNAMGVVVIVQVGFIVAEISRFAVADAAWATPNETVILNIAADKIAAAHNFPKFFIKKPLLWDDRLTRVTHRLRASTMPCFSTRETSKTDPEYTPLLGPNAAHGVLKEIDLIRIVHTMVQHLRNNYCLKLDEHKGSRREPSIAAGEYPLWWQSYWIVLGKLLLYYI
jgi:hypothetical protein